MISPWRFKKLNYFHKIPKLKKMQNIYSDFVNGPSTGRLAMGENEEEKVQERALTAHMATPSRPWLAVMTTKRKRETTRRPFKPSSIKTYLWAFNRHLPAHGPHQRHGWPDLPTRRAGEVDRDVSGQAAAPHLAHDQGAHDRDVLSQPVCQVARRRVH